MSQITTHVLDTAKGKPAVGIQIILQKETGKDQWEKIAGGTTNSDGRIPAFLSPVQTLTAGVYRMNFETKPYFDRQNIKAFYPYIIIVFEILDDEHYHVPLLLNPFGYTTYRGT